MKGEGSGDGVGKEGVGQQNITFIVLKLSIFFTLSLTLSYIIFNSLPVKKSTTLLWNYFTLHCLLTPVTRCHNKISWQAEGMKELLCPTVQYNKINKSVT